MAGQGGTKARRCIKLRGLAFRERPKVSGSIVYCRACGYQVTLHESILRQMIRAGEFKPESP